MKTIRTFSKLFAVIAIVAMVLSFASCKGSLKLESFTVDRSSIKTVYLVGETVDFSGIKATAKYSDASLNKVYTHDELKIEYPDNITETVGTKKVTVSFQDPHLNVQQSTTFDITVKDANSSEPQNLTGFAAPSGITAFLAANNNAGTGKYGEGTFSSVFAKKEAVYVIGDDNPFIFLPNAIVRGDNGPEQVSSFHSDVELFLEKDGTYVALTATKGEGNIVTFHDGETLIATVDTYECSYQFTEDAVGYKVKFSVLPSEEHYNFKNFPAIVFEAKIIDAYNVFEAWQLAIIANDSEDGIWDDLRAQYGFTDENVAGIVLHNNIKVTANDVPADFFFTTDQETVYTKAGTDETITIPAGTKFLKDWSEIYRRELENGESFVIEGNLFTIDASEFPLVPSPGVFDLEDEDDDYGAGFSNATLIKIVSTLTDTVEDFANFEIKNLGIKGNAARNNYLDDGGNLVSAGGLICFKALDSVNVEIDNVIGNSWYMSYFAEGDVIVNATDVKCYDSYSNAVLVWANSTVTFRNSYINGSGGPAVICSGLKASAGYHQPIFNSENTIIETSLTGSEVWFAATNSTPVVGEMQELGYGLEYAGIGNFVKDGKMNIKGLIMYDGSKADEIMGQIGALGQFTIDGKGFSRLPDDATWSTINQLWAFMPATQAAPFLTVQDAEGNSHTLFYNGEGFCDLSCAAFNPDPTNGGSMEHYATYVAFKSADTITLTMGGISVVFEFYPTPMAQ